MDDNFYGIVCPFHIGKQGDIRRLGCRSLLGVDEQRLSLVTALPEIVGGDVIIDGLGMLGILTNDHDKRLHETGVALVGIRGQMRLDLLMMPYTIINHSTIQLFFTEAETLNIASGHSIGCTCISCLDGC